MLSGSQEEKVKGRISSWHPMLKMHMMTTPVLIPAAHRDASVLSLSVYLGQVESRISILMAPKTAASELPIIFKLQFTDTHFGWECLANKNLKNYNDVYHEVEKSESLYVEEEISEDDVEYKSDLMLIKAAGLHKIAAKPEVFPCKDLFCKSLANCTLERGILGSPAGNVAIISGLYGAADTDHGNQYWVPLLGEIIMNDRKPDLSEGYLKLIGAWWYFENATIIRVEGTLVPPTALPVYVPDRLMALEVARQRNYGVERRCKMVNQKPYPFLPFKIGDFYFQNWPALEKYAREIETMNLKGKGVMRCWDPYGKVREHLKSIQDKESEDTSSQTHAEDVETEEVEIEETNEVLKQKLLSGLLSGLLEVQLPSTSVAMVSSLAPFTTSTFGSDITLPSSVGPDATIVSHIATPSVFKIPPPGSMLSPFTPPLSSTTTPLVLVPISPTPSSSTTSVLVLCTTSTFTSSSQSTSLTTEVVATVSTVSLPLLCLSTSSFLPSTTTVSRGEEVHKSQEMETTLPLDLSIGIRVSPFISLQPSLWSSPTFIVPPPPVSLTSPLTISQSTLDTSAAITLVALGFSNLVFTTEESTMASAIDSSTLSSTITTTTMLSAVDSPVSLQHLEVTLEYDKSTSSLKKVTKRKIKIGEQVTVLQIEENLLSLTKKRKRGTKGAGMDVRELTADLVYIVRSTNKMSKEAVERMQMELSQAHDKIIEEAKAKANQVHHQVQSSFNWIGEWEAKLATLENVAHRSLLPNVPGGELLEKKIMQRKFWE
eukprot:Gb_37952 [translate_table: standard]